MRTTIARSANARTRISSPVNVLANAVHRSTRAMVSVTMRTTIAAASSMEATAVINQSRVGVSKQPTAPQYKGDGICDDENNNCGCKFDGGDCCNKSVKGGSVKTTYCTAVQGRWYL